jgi:hypothetical protein
VPVKRFIYIFSLLITCWIGIENVKSVFLRKQCWALSKNVKTLLKEKKLDSSLATNPKNAKKNPVIKKKSTKSLEFLFCYSFNKKQIYFTRSKLKLLFKTVDYFHPFYIKNKRGPPAFLTS